MSAPAEPELPRGGGLVGVAVRQPVFTTMVMAGLMVLGAFSFRRLAIDEFPQISFPIVSIVAAYPGAAPEVVERTVTQVLEEAVGTTPGIQKVTSVSLEGVSTITAQFHLGVDVPTTVASVRSNLEQAMPRLPQGIEPPLVQQFNTSDQPVLSLALSSKSRSVMELTELAEGDLRRALEGVEGVGRVQVSGGVSREVAVRLDLAKLRAMGLSPGDVVRALDASQVDLPAGRISDGNREVLVRALSRTRTPAGLERVVVARRGGTPVRLEQVATVVERPAEAHSGAYINGKPAIGIDLLKTAGANTVTVAAAVQRTVAAIASARSGDVSIEVVRDNAVSIRASVEAVQGELLLGALLTVLVVFLFLGDLRATAITSLALPVSVVSAFTLMYALRFTLNTLTLMALSISIGLLIDDAIVVIESVVRKREAGATAFVAALDGTREIFLAVMATTLSIVAVFVPVAFMSGIIGRFFYEFGLTVAWAVLVSLFVSFTLTPMLAAWWPPALPSSRRPGPLRSALARFDRAFDGLGRRYRGVISWVLGHRKTTLLVALAAFVLSLGLVPLVGGGMMPEQDTSEFTISFSTPTGSSLAYTSDKGLELDALLRRLPGVASTYVVIGSTDGSVFVRLVPTSARRLRQPEVMALARRVVASLYGVRGTVLAQTTASLTPKPIQVAVTGPNIEILRSLSDRVAVLLASVPGVIEIDSSLARAAPGLRIEVDAAYANDLAVSPRDLGGSVFALLSGRRATRLEDASGQERDVVVRAAPPGGDSAPRLSLDDLPGLPVASRRADSQGNGFLDVALSRIARLNEADEPTQIDREDLARVARITANLESGVSLSTASARIAEAVRRIALPEGYAVRLGGDTEQMAETAGYVLESILLAIILIYLILASQFGSFVQPLAIMLSLPLSLVGVMLALLATGDTLNMMSMIGVIMLMGLVTKNAILLVDSANQNRRRGLSLSDALVEAGEKRLRPIAMTTLAMIFGMLPIAVGLGEGAAFRAPMARAVIGGLVTSTLLTLLVVPVVTSYLDGASTRVRRLLRSRTGSASPGLPTQG